MSECIRTDKNKMSKRSKVLTNTRNEIIFPERLAQLLPIKQECSQLEILAKEIKKDFEKVTKLVDALKSPTVSNKQKNIVKSAVVKTNQEEVEPSCNNNHKCRRRSDESISSTDAVLISNKNEKVLIFDKARTLLNTGDHSNKPDNKGTKRALSDTAEYCDKSDSPDNKKARTLPTTTINYNISGTQSNDKVLVLKYLYDKSASPSKKMALTSSVSTDRSDKSAGPSKKMALASPKTTDSDKSTDPSKKLALASSYSTDRSDKTAGPSKKMAVTSSNTTGSDKSAGSRKKVAPASPNLIDHSDKSPGPTKKMVLASSDSTDRSDKSGCPSKMMTLAPSNTTDSNKSAGPSKNMALASSNATDLSKESDELSDKENQPNERIPPPVAAQVAQEEDREDDLVPIGSGHTLVRRDVHRKINWKSYNTATRSLLRAVFSREILSTHSLTGKRSPAFPDRPAKMCLDKQKVMDIIIEVKQRFDIKENIIRNLITVKCADESKMMKMRLMKEANK